MPGFDPSTLICTNTDGTFTIRSIGEWVDSFFNDVNASPVDEGNGVHTIPVTGNFSILNTDSRGNIHYTPITNVVRYTVSEMSPAPNMVTVSTLWGKKFTCADDALLVTRIDNNVSSKPISEFAVYDDYFTMGMISHIPTGVAPNLIVREVQYNVDYNTVVAHVITNTWGDYNFTRNECENCIQVIQSDPSMDQSDIQPMTDAIGENTEYDQIVSIDAAAAPGSFLYDLRTESGAYQMLNQFNTGVPPEF